MNEEEEEQKKIIVQINPYGTSTQHDIGGIYNNKGISLNDFYANYADFIQDGNYIYIGSSEPDIENFAENSPFGISTATPAKIWLDTHAE